MKNYAIDFGTTNTVAARWDDDSGSVRLMEFPGVSRGAEPENPVRNEHAVPSSLHLGPVRKKFFLRSQDTAIGKAALNKETWNPWTPVIRRFKPALMRDPGEVMARQDHQVWTAQDCTRRFLKELCRAIQTAEGSWPRSLTLCVPVDSYENYRSALRHIALSLGIRQLKLVDEPVAAAIGYGLNLDEPKPVLVFDFGGGTLDLALVTFESKLAQAGRCRVIAKSGLPLGGSTIDSWILDWFCKASGFEFSQGLPGDTEVWKNLVLDEARRVKEALYARQSECFYLVPPEEYRDFDWMLRSDPEDTRRTVMLDRLGLLKLLEDRGLFGMLDSCLDQLFRSAASQGFSADDLGQVLMVGGSSLLPGVFPFFEKRFGRARVQAWQPFNAVAYGAALHASGHWTQSDIITHDYALLTHDPKTFEARYQVVIPRNTPFPTAPDFWKRKLVPTCSSGLPEKVFKLLVCEIGRKHYDYQEFCFDTQGAARELAEGMEELIVPLNQDDPALGVLNPPHHADNKKPRIELSLMVNEDKWLCATVTDLLNGKVLMDRQTVVRLR